MFAELKISAAYVKITPYFMVKHRYSPLDHWELEYIIVYAKESLYHQIQLKKSYGC